MELNYNCDCPPINYDSVGFPGQQPGLNLPVGGTVLSFTSTDFSASLACDMGREIGFSAFAQMGSSLAAGAEAMIILAMNQCNLVLNQNEALIAKPAASATQKTTTTVYHESGSCLPPGAPKGATDAYITNYKDDKGQTHESIVYTKNGVEIGQQDLVLNFFTSATLLDKDGHTLANGAANAAAGDEVKLSDGKTYKLVDTNTKDASGHEIFGLQDSDGNIKGSISFSGNSGADGAIGISQSAALDYDSASASHNGNGVLTDGGNNVNCAAAKVGDKIVINNVTYTLSAGDKAGTFNLTDDSNSGNVLYNVTINNTTDANGNTTYSYSDKLPAGFVDGFALQAAGKDASGNTVQLSDVGSGSSAPTTNSTSTTPITQNTADPLTTMSAVFKYAEVYAAAMTMMSTYEQCNIDMYKGKPH